MPSNTDQNKVSRAPSRLREPLSALEYSRIAAVLHSMCCSFSKSIRLVSDKGNYHAVQIEEEHDKVEAELDERFL